MDLIAHRASTVGNLIAFAGAMLGSQLADNITGR